MAGYALQQTVAKQAFLVLKPFVLINQNLDNNECFIRAMKIFRMSFAGVEHFDAALYQTKLDEYMNVVADLYDIPNANQINWNGRVQNELLNEFMEVVIGVKRLKWDNQAMNPRVTMNNGIQPQSVYRLLDPTEELQYLPPFVGEVQYDMWRQIRAYGGITIAFNADNWTQNVGQLAQFQLLYAQIPAEGFEDWFEFGRGIKLLIKIEFLVSEAQRATQAAQSAHEKFVSDFHYHSLIFMISKRLTIYRQSQRMEGLAHKHPVHKKKLSYIRSRVDPRSADAYWVYPPTGFVESIQRLSITQTQERYRNAMRRERYAKFIDLQIGYQFSDEYEDSFCLCNEWCNWNAFFHYNPIYRFLLVQHNQLYLLNRTNIPDMYVFASLYHVGQTCTNVMGQLIPANQSLPKTPLFRLISSANEYQEKIQIICMGNAQCMSDFFKSVPHPTLLRATQYNLLRYDIRADIFSQTASGYLSDDAIENIKLYYKMLSELHSMLIIHDFVDNANKKVWMRELDAMSRILYATYITNSYRVLMTSALITRKSPFVDYLFSEDYEYSNAVALTELQRYGKSVREKVWKYGSYQNVLNIKFFCGSLISGLILVNKFIQSVEPSLPKHHTPHGLNAIFTFCEDFDSTSFNYRTQYNIDFKIDANVLEANQLHDLRRNYFLFYTLKIYFVAYSLQKYLMYSVFNHSNKVTGFVERQVSNCFRFIWTNDYIDSTFLHQYNERLYEINNSIQNKFREFYEDFWGKAYHEVTGLPEYRDYITSALHEYQRLWFWWANDGDNRPIFLKFLNSLEINLGKIENRSKVIFRQYIASASQTFFALNCVYYSEVIDTLVYYLMKATCFMIVRNITVYFNRIHTLQNALLVTMNSHFTLTKPGWVPIFRTMRRCFDFLYYLRTQYIVFDDEFNRISETLKQTKYLVKEVYKFFFKKLLTNFFTETMFAINMQNVDEEETYRFLCLNICVGVSFLAAFINDFRESSTLFRYRLNKAYLALSVHPGLARHQTALNDTWPLCLDYLDDPNEIRTAIPFQSNIWTTNLEPQILGPMHQLTAADVDIDLQAANVEI